MTQVLIPALLLGSSFLLALASARRETAAGAVPRNPAPAAADYTTWNPGVGYALNDHVGLDVRYFDTDEHKLGSIYDSRVVGRIKLTF